MLDVLDLSDEFQCIREDAAALFARMDAAYDAAAAQYGFVCAGAGCTDNCCLTRFHHHTLVEYCFLMEGFAGLDPALQDALQNRAAAVNRAVAEEEAAGRTPRIMCPLNQDGRCLLYAYRPMICRLHGIPHVFAHPFQGTISGPGCHEFEARCGASEGRPLDRTAVYRDLSRLEQEFRQMTGVTEKIKKTVAQMLVNG